MSNRKTLKRPPPKQKRKKPVSKQSAVTARQANRERQATTVPDNDEPDNSCDHS
jgi:hypothetical protein